MGLEGKMGIVGLMRSESIFVLESYRQLLIKYKRNVSGADCLRLDDFNMKGSKIEYVNVDVCLCVYVFSFIKCSNHLHAQRKKK